jgi:hypothetical protein
LAAQHQPNSHPKNAMARKIFFSFHYDHDNWRVSQVRNSGFVHKVPPFLDRARWEDVKKGGDPEIKRWIDRNLHGTSVTCVLIGRDTSQRRWVRYEIEQSLLRGNGLLGIDIHNLKDQNGMTDARGRNPFDTATVDTDNGGRVTVSTAIAQSGMAMHYYDWRDDRGAARDRYGVQNFTHWVERAARHVGR